MKIMAVSNQPMIDFRDFDGETLDEKIVNLAYKAAMRHSEWASYEPERRLKTVDWTPTFLAISERRERD